MHKNKYGSSSTLALALALLYMSSDAIAQKTSPVVQSQFSILVDVDSGKVMWGRGANVHRSIASTTKIMTALLLLERGHLQDQVVAPPGVDKIQESSLHLSPGEKLSLEDLLYAMLLRSANDTAVTGAVYLNGSVPAFVRQMNLRAQQIGAMHTHFVTPNGLYAPDHYSTAFDLAVMARYAALTQPVFNRIVSTQRYIIHRSIHKSDSLVINTSKSFLKFFPGADGMKTGYIHQAGHCFVSSATRNNWRMIAVSLNSPKCREDDMSLLNYGFANFQRAKAVLKGTDIAHVSLPNGSLASVGVSADVSIPVSKWSPVPAFSSRFIPLTVLPEGQVAAGTVIGTVEISANGVLQSVVPAVVNSTLSTHSLPLTGSHYASVNSHFGLPLSFLASAFLILMGLQFYGRTPAKGTGGSWSWIPSSLRTANPRRTNPSFRPNGHRTRD